MLKLRGYQQQGVDAIRDSFFAGKRAPLYVLPTGGGKTVVFSYISATVAARDKKVLVLAHRIELIRQTSAALQSNDVYHGIINPKFTPNLHAKTQVASVQTLVRRLDKYGFYPDLIIIDEAHHANAKSWKLILEKYPKSRVLGVTATPIRADGSGLGIDAGGMFDELIIGPQIPELIKMGFLAQPLIYAPKERLDLSAVHTVRGDYDLKEAADLVDQPVITGHAVEYYTKLCPGKPAVAFCVSIAHAQHVAQEFRNAGYTSYSVDGQQDDETRKRILAGLANGSINVVTSCDLISEGTDIPQIACAILLRPTQSTGLYLQQIGRALRPKSDFGNAIILDHVGNVITHGLPDEIREWSLDGMEKRKRRRNDEDMIDVMQCPQCYCMHAPAPSCAACGYEYPVKEQSEGEVPEASDGELRAIMEADRIAIKRQRGREIGQAETLSELEAIAAKYNYKPGWAKYQLEFKKKKLKVVGVRPT